VKVSEQSDQVARK